MIVATSIVRAGDEGILVFLEGVDSGALATLRDLLLDEPGIAACVVGHSSLLLLPDSGWPGGKLGRGAIERAIRICNESPRNRVPYRHEISVDFSSEWSPDLPLLASRAGLEEREVVERLASLRLRARYLGFLAGFVYLEGMPDEWALPRRPEARIRVPEGSFAVAGTMAGLYPAETPGGWNLIGRTDAELWNPDRDPPNLIEPGDEIRIVPVQGLAFDRPSRVRAREMAGVASAEVLETGQRTLVVGDLRMGRLRHGIAEGGAFDRGALEAANHAVGNPGGAAALEVVLVGPRIRALRDSVMSWFGAEATPMVNGRSVSDARQFVVAAGDVIEIGPVRRGARGVLAMQGGLVDDSPRYATSPMSLRRGDVLRTYRRSSAVARIGRLDRNRNRLLIRAQPGPHDLSDALGEAIERRTWTVSRAFDRVGVRLASTEPIPPDLPADLPSCGMQFGSVQWHPGGELVMMGPDHPITGGYLQPMTVVSSELWKIGQLAPGDRVRFALAKPHPAGV